MKLDRTFQREIQKKANGDGSKEAQFAFIKVVRETAKELSTPKVRTLFDSIVKKHGRVSVAICVAITIIRRKDRLEYSSYQWAMEVCKLWTNKPMTFEFAVIDDNLHPIRIEEYAKYLMDVTTEKDVLKIASQMKEGDSDD